MVQTPALAARDVPPRAWPSPPIHCRIGELLWHAEPHCPGGLIPPSAWAALRSLPESFPAASAIGAFECRLEAGAERTDFELCLRAAGAGRTALAAGLDALAAAIPPASAGWPRVLAVLREWVDPGSPLYGGLPVLWIEFDLEAAAPEPFVVLTLQDARGEDGHLRPAAERCLARALALQSDGRSAAPAIERIRAAVEMLPPRARLLHVALRPSAAGDVLRLIVKLPWEGIPAYLESLRWTGSTADLREWLGVSCRATPCPSLNIDLGPTAGPRIGIEHHFPSDPRTDLRWRALFDALQAAGACAPERRRQLEAWPSHADPSPPPGLVRVERELLVKVVYQTGEALRAKAYLPFRPLLNLA